jgi:hypothetical protein
MRWSLFRVAQCLPDAKPDFIGASPAPSQKKARVAPAALER